MTVNPSTLDFQGSPTETVEQRYQKETRVSLSRCESAEMKRSVEGMKNAYVSLKPIVSNKMMENVSNASIPADFYDEIKTLNEMKDNIQKMEEIIKSTPVETPRRTTAQEQKEIKGFYETGKYLEEELAEQYSLTQSGVNKIINR